jgi:hypothetical protein
MNYLVNARKYFDDFRDAHVHEYREKMRGYRIHPHNGYGFFSDSDYVTQTMRNICGNLEEVFETTDIPGKFVTPRALVIKWQGFRELLRVDEHRFNEIRDELLKDYRKKSKSEPESPFDYLPEPFIQFDAVRHEVTEVLDHILEMDEVKQVMKNKNEPSGTNWIKKYIKPILVAIGLAGGGIAVTVNIIHSAPSISQSAANQATQIGSVQGNVIINTPPATNTSKEKTETKRLHSEQQIQNTTGQSINNMKAGHDITNVNVFGVSPIATHKPVLQPLQEKLLELLYKYQKQFGATKLVVSRDEGRIYIDDKNGQGSTESLINDIYGSITERNAGLFEALVENMPPEYVRLFPENRLDTPFVISITNEGSRYLHQAKE